MRPADNAGLGAAVRHAAAELARQPQKKKLLLVLTDGKPNDVDHYEGRFAVTVDATAQSDFPPLFGRGGYAIVGNIRRLPAALPAIYRQVAH